MRPLKYLIPLFLLPLLASCVTMGSEPGTLTLVYSGNLNGELEPCGCSESGNLGGIKRRAAMVDKLRAENANLFLVSAGGIVVSEMPQDRLKSEYILKGLAALDYDAVGVQWQDLAFGEAFLKNSKLPLVASNWHNDDLAHRRLIERGGHKLAFFQWLTPGDDPSAAMQDASASHTSTGALADAITAAKTKGATTVLATTLALPQAQQQLPLAQVDLLIIRANYEVYGEPQKIGRTWVLQPGSRGMRLGRADVEVDENGNVTALTHEAIPLPPAVSDAPRMVGWYQEYNDRVKQEYEQRVEARKALESGDSPYAGEQACQSCHTKEHETWFGSRHAEAFYALQDVNKAFDPDCLSCHTVGFDRPGGFIDPELTQQLTHVQCESCHGQARAHAESGGRTPVANAAWSKAQMCGQCHVHEHSPDFDIERYWPKIAHGKDVSAKP